LARETYRRVRMASPPSDRELLAALATGARAVVDVGEEAIECRVADVAGGEVALAPLTGADAAYISSLGRAATLAFTASERRARVPGAVHRGASADELRFVAGGGADLPPRRREARAAIELPVEVTPLDAAGEPAAEPRRLVTTDISLGGLGVHAPGWALAEGALVRVALELPQPPPLTGTARVLRTAHDVAGLGLEHVAVADRARLAAFLLGR
jgi:hypothetical protein